MPRDAQHEARILENVSELAFCRTCLRDLNPETEYCMECGDCGATTCYGCKHGHTTKSFGHRVAE